MADRHLYDGKEYIWSLQNNGTHEATTNSTWIQNHGGGAMQQGSETVRHSYSEHVMPVTPNNAYVAGTRFFHGATFSHARDQGELLVTDTMSMAPVGQVATAEIEIRNQMVGGCPSSPSYRSSYQGHSTYRPNGYHSVAHEEYGMPAPSNHLKASGAQKSPILPNVYDTQETRTVAPSRTAPQNRLPGPPSRPSRNHAEYSVPCTYRCGTVLTGEHALGNLTRHLKSRACRGSSMETVRYICPIEGCGREYARSDGLRVHMRRRHNAPPPPPRRADCPEDEE